MDYSQESMNKSVIAALIPPNRWELAYRFTEEVRDFVEHIDEFEPDDLYSKLVPKLVKAVPACAFDALQPVDQGILIFHGGISAAEVPDFQHDLLRTHMNLPTGQPIKLYLSSFGGAVYAGLALASTIYEVQREGREVHVHVQGTAMSMATAILAVADRRTMESLASIMIHKISYGMSGSIDDHEEQLREAEKLNRRLFSLYTARTHKPISYYLDKVKKTDWHLDAGEALAENLVDAVTGPPLFPYVPPEGDE